MCHDKSGPGAVFLTDLSGQQEFLVQTLKQMDQTRLQILRNRKLEADSDDNSPCANRR